MDNFKMHDRLEEKTLEDKIERGEDKIITKGPGRFSELVPQFKRVSHISEIDLIHFPKNKQISRHYIGGDGVGYTCSEEKGITLFLTDFPNNLIMKYPKNSVEQLIRYGNVFVSLDDVLELMAKAHSGDRSVSAFELSKLNLKERNEECQKGNNEYVSIEVPINMLEENNSYQLRERYGETTASLFHRVFGDLWYGHQPINKLPHEENNTATIYLLNPTHVKKVLEEKDGETMIARLSRLSVYKSGDNIDIRASLADSNTRNLKFVSGVEEPSSRTQEGVDYKAVREALRDRNFNPRELAEQLVSDPQSVKNLSSALLHCLSPYMDRFL